MFKFLSGMAFGIFLAITAMNPAVMKGLANKSVDAVHNGLASSSETLQKAGESDLVTKTKDAINEVVPK